MRREIFRIGIGVAVIAVHTICFFMIYYKDAYLSPSQKLDVALLFMPITTAYVVAIVKSAIDEKGTKGLGPSVNLNYAIIVILFTVITLVGLLITVGNMTASMEDRRYILLFEIAFGAGFGLIASDLFGKIERIEVPSPPRSVPTTGGTTSNVARSRSSKSKT
jgi:hypothetical protein